LTVFELELEIAHGGAEHHGLDLGTGVLEREIHVARVPEPAVRDLSFDPDIAEARFEQVANGTGQFGDGVDAALGGSGPPPLLFKRFGEKVRHGYSRARWLSRVGCQRFDILHR
jgi:hypothetical protein